MSGRRSFEEVTARLVEACRSTPGVAGLILLGSTTAAGAARRDAASDHDFFAVLQPEAEPAVRESLAFLPDPGRIVLLAREHDGASVLYDDGHLLEFGVGTLGEIGPRAMNAAEIAIAGPGLRAFVDEALARGGRPDPGKAGDAVRLALIKLLIGGGRAHRGEVVSGGVFVRAHAVGAIALAVRRRDGPGAAEDGLDPLRRLERDHPVLAAAIESAVAQPVLPAALALLDLLRAEFAGPDFPVAGAALVERILRERSAG